MKKKNKVICKCNNVTKGAIVEAVKKGADSIKKIKLATGICKGCCGCNKNIKKIMKKQLQKKQLQKKKLQKKKLQKKLLQKKPTTSK